MQPVITDKGSGIMYRKSRASPPKAVLLLIHGLGGQSSRFEFLADFLLQSNISSYAIELKGFGETKSLAGHIDSFNNYIEEILVLYNIIHSENPASPIFLLGESMGALIAFLEAIQKPDFFSGLICISPVFKSKLKFTFLDYIQIYLSFLYNLEKQFRVPFDSQMCTRDTAYQKIMESDPREHRLATSKMLANILIAQIQCRHFKGKLKMPVLFLLAGNDLIVDYKTSELFFNTLPTPDKGIIIYPEMFHALTIDLGREQVFNNILSWIKQKIDTIS